MNELLILYLLTKGQSTMYGLSKSLYKNYGFITKPGFGTLQPALKRLEKQNFIKADKFFSDGGKPYYYYSILEEGKEFLTKKLMEKITTNPIQFYPFAKIKIACSDVLSKDERLELFKSLKYELQKIKLDAESLLESETLSNNFCHKMVLNTTVCEYNNFVNLIEDLENACNS